MTEVVVLGGGPAGLAAAYRAARAGRDVVLLERGQGPGGAAASFEVGGIRVDHGSHRLHPSIRPDILAELQDLLGDDLQRRPRNGRIRLAGRWIAFPLRASDLIRRLPVAFGLAAARDAITAWRRRPRADTFADVLRARLGPAICDAFYFPYARKLWGLDPNEISGEQARRRVSAGSPVKILLRLVGGAADNAFFWYPRKGFGAISERLAEAAGEAGADLRFGAAARTIDFLDDRVRVSLATGGAVEASRVWSTIPLPALARMSRPAPPAEVLEATGRLRSRSMVLVYLVLAADRYTPFDAHYLPEEWTPVTRISEPKNYREARERAGRTVLCAEIPCEQGDELWSADEDRLGAIVAKTLADAGLPPPALEDVAVKRLSHAYPIYRLGFESAFATLDGWAGAQRRLLSFGRQGLFAHDNTHHALAMAWAAADALGPEGSFDDHRWSSAREMFATHVVED